MNTIKSNTKIDINIRNKFPLQEVKIKNFFNEDDSPRQNLQQKISSNDVKNVNNYVIVSSDSNKDKANNFSNEKIVKSKADNNNYFNDMLIAENKKVEHELERLKNNKKVTKENKEKINK